MEVVTMQDGWYLRSNGVFLKELRYATREEALGQAWSWAGRATHQDGSHVKVDATLSVSYRTNVVADTNITGAWFTNYYRQVWISFDLSGFPFKGLVQEQPVVGTP